jgi:hypothetical protein
MDHPRWTNEQLLVLFDPIGRSSDLPGTGESYDYFCEICLTGHERSS